MCPQRACTMPTLRVGKVRQQPVQEIGCRQEVRVEDGDVLAAGRFQPGFERAGLVAGAICAMEILDVDAVRRHGGGPPLRDVRGLVGRVVQNLDFEQIARVIEAANGSISRSATYISL